MYEGFEISAGSLVTEVQTLFQELKAARDNINFQRMEPQHQKQQSCEYQSHPSETQRIADERDSAQRDSQNVHVIINADEKRRSDRWRDAALKSVQDASPSQTHLQDLLSEKKKNDTISK